MLFLEAEQLYFSDKKKRKPWQKLKDCWLEEVLGIWASNPVSVVVLGQFTCRARGL